MPSKEPAWLSEVDHTADVGIAVSAPDLKTLFARAAWGTFNVLTDMDRVEPRDEARVTVEGSDRDDLMVRWLSELNFLHVTQHRLFCTFEIQELNDQHLVATVRGEAIDPDRHTVYTEIKAVTFHGLDVHEADGSWRAQIIFDM